MSNILSSVESLLDKVDKFDRMTGPQQAAFRAQLTRLQNQDIDDPEIAQILADIEAAIPEKESKTYSPQTVEEIVAEYESKWMGYSARQRAGFKAKLTRRVNAADEAGEADDLEKLTGLQDRIESEARKARMDRIRAKAAKLQGGDEG